MNSKQMYTALVFAVSFIMILGLPAALQAQDSGTTVGGYGELHYNDPEGSAEGVLDFHRFVIYLNHDFNDWISFVSELELEHTYVSNVDAGEISLEQAFLEFRTWEDYGFRGGIMLIPVGLINQYHEPNTFHGVERPNFHKYIIPTTWREAGAGAYGRPAEGLELQLYVFSGLVAEGFSAKGGLRGGRQKAIRSSTADMAVSGRIDYMPLAGLSIGGSFFVGNSTQKQEALGDGTVSMIAGDVRYNIGQLALRGEAAVATIADAEKINSVYENNVADRLDGWYLEAAYNILPHFDEMTQQQFHFFARYEVINTQAEVTGFDPLLQYNRNETTLGVSYLPDPNVVLKVDYQFFGNEAVDKSSGQFNAGIGYAFF